MKLTLNQLIDQLELGLTSKQKTFSNEIIRSRMAGGLIFSNLRVLNIDFIDIDFSPAKFINCKFTNCNFTRAEIDRCHFKTCKIVYSGLTRTEILNTILIKCQFLDSCLDGAFFNNCKFIEPKFKNIDYLDCLSVHKSKIWTSKKWITINLRDNFEKIIEDLKN